MFMNGVMIGMIQTITKTAQRIIRKVLHRARIVCIVAVAGTSMPSIAVLLIVPTTTQATSSAIWASALPIVLGDIHLCFEPAQ